MVVVFRSGKAVFKTRWCMAPLLMALSFISLNIPLANTIWVAAIAMLVGNSCRNSSHAIYEHLVYCLYKTFQPGQYAAIIYHGLGVAQVAGSLSGKTSIVHALGFQNLWWIIRVSAVLLPGVSIPCTIKNNQASSGFIYSTAEIQKPQLLRPCTNSLMMLLSYIFYVHCIHSFPSCKSNSTASLLLMVTPFNLLIWTKVSLFESLCLIKPNPFSALKT